MNAAIKTELIGGRRVVDIHHQVRPSDLDSFGHVNNAKVLEFFELGRLMWLQAVELQPATGIVPVLVHAELRYLCEILLGPLIIRTQLVAQTFYSVVFEQGILVDAVEGRKAMAHGRLTVNFIDVATRRPRKLRDYV